MHAATFVPLKIRCISQHLYTALSKTTNGNKCDEFLHAFRSLRTISCWIKLFTFFVYATCFNLAWCCTRLATFVQHYCTGASALVWFAIWKHHPTYCNILQQGGQTCVTCCAQQSVALCCVEMLRAFGQFLHNMIQQLLHQCCVRLASSFITWSDNFCTNVACVWPVPS